MIIICKHGGGRLAIAEIDTLDGITADGDTLTIPRRDGRARQWSVSKASLAALRIMQAYTAGDETCEISGATREEE